jgi:hypothetical protein
MLQRTIATIGAPKTFPIGGNSRRQATKETLFIAHRRLHAKENQLATVFDFLEKFIP